MLRTFSVPRYTRSISSEPSSPCVRRAYPMKRSPLPFVISFIAELVMAYIMALVVGAMTGGEPTWLAGLVFGFVL